MNDILRLLSLCKCGVYITVNEHRDSYESAEKSLNEIESFNEEKLDIAPEVREVMHATNTIIRIQFYPDTPVGCYLVYHHDLQAAVKIALSALEPYADASPTKGLPAAIVDHGSTPIRSSGDQPAFPLSRIASPGNSGSNLTTAADLVASSRPELAAHNDKPTSHTAIAEPIMPKIEK